MQHLIRIEGTFGLDVTVQTVRSQLQAAPAGGRPTVRINSEGGSVQEAVAVYTELLAHPGGVDTEVSGWALSAATIVLQAGKRRSMGATGLLMVHAPWLSTAGNADQLRESAAVLDQVRATMRVAYRRTGKSDAQIDAWLDGADHWFTADDALRAGLVDEVLDYADASALATFRQAMAACRFPVPSHILERLDTMTTPNTQGADAVSAAVLAEAQRGADIRAAFKAYARDIPEAVALLESSLANPAVSLAKFKAELLEVNNKGVESIMGNYVARDPYTGAHDGMKTFMAAAVDTLCLRSGMRVEEPHPAAADLRRTSIVGMAERVLSMRGQSTARRSPSDLISAALATDDFPLLLSNLAGKMLRNGYESSPASFRGWTGERTVANFKEHSLLMLSEAPALLEKMEGAEYKHGHFSEGGTKFTVKTHGRMLSITREALINDDLSALTAMPRAFGQAAVRLEADQVYALLTSNPTLSDSVALFDAAHGNVSTAAAPSIASLGLARAAMRKQKGLQGTEYIDAQPRYIVAPVALETTFEQLLASLVDPSKSNATPNVEWVKNLQLACDPRLDATSASVWYLATAPEQIEGVLRAYIETESRPHLEEEQVFSRDLVNMKCRLDFATGIVDYRGLHRVG
ncbi:MAG: Clp protease ClpP [Rubrivivax sp.]|nr:Clp protease ClpP [Rubrivivax sp.]